MSWDTKFQALRADGEATTTSLELHSASSASNCSWPNKQHEGQGEHQPSSVDKWDPIMASMIRTSSSASGGGTNELKFNAAAAAASSMDVVQQTLGIVSTAATTIKPIESTASAQHSSRDSSSALRASQSAGGTATKVSKKRSRASRRPPTTVLEADSTNFRSMVQQLTGIPTPPPILTSLHPSRFDFLIRPQPCRPFGGLLEDPQFPFSSYTLRRPLDALTSYRSPPLDATAAAALMSDQHHLQASSMATSDIKNIAAPAAYGATAAVSRQGGGAGGGATPGLSMPSLWECEAKAGESRIKREVRIDEATGGRPPWSSGL